MPVMASLFPSLRSLTRGGESSPRSEMLVRSALRKELLLPKHDTVAASKATLLFRRRVCQQELPFLKRIRRGAVIRAVAETEGNETPLPLPRDDDVHSCGLQRVQENALMQASEATAAAVNRGATECIVEVLIPEFWDPISGPVFSEEGDNLRFWKLCRRYLENLQALFPSKSIKALFPDMGVAIMVKNQWQDATFQIGCLTSKAETVEDVEILVMGAPDPQCFDSCRRIVDEAPEGCVVVMFNPRLASGDVGIGLNVRRMREGFLKSFVTVYSLRPIGDIGSVFRKFPGLWLVFLEDETTPGRYKLVAERPSRPAGDALDAILQEAQRGATAEEEERPSSLLDSVTLPIRSFQRFMKSLM